MKKCFPFFLACLLVVGAVVLNGCSKPNVTIDNPLLYSDVPDPDVVCVGKNYYMISTTMHMSPGAPIMQSADMKHWRIIGYVFDELHESPANDLEGGNIYSRGQWAASLRYYNKQFYVFFGTGVHSYIYRATDPAGPWEMVSSLKRYYHDASMLFDPSGKVYLVHCHRGGMYVKQFKADFQDFEDGDADGTRIIALGDRFLHEGVHAYNIDGKYYLTTIWWPGGKDRTELCFRSDNIYGPYEHRIILSDDLGYARHGVAQGGIWKAHNGQWYAMLFQDHEGIGRIPCLMPCTWKDGWPMLGDESGKVPHQFVIPGIKESGSNYYAGSDDFDNEQLALIWQWNHNSDKSKWSLKERPGFLRLHTVKVVEKLFDARNTLTQRTEGPQCVGTVKLDITHMLEGDRTGLFAFCAESGGLTVERGESNYILQMSDRGEIHAELPFNHHEIWLRMGCDFTTDTAHFSYSFNGTDFTRLGTDFHMIFNLVHFTGNKFAIFNYATKQTGGYVDVDSFELTK